VTVRIDGVHRIVLNVTVQIQTLRVLFVVRAGWVVRREEAAEVGGVESGAEVIQAGFGVGGWGRDVFS